MGAGETEISDVKVEHVWVEDKPGMEIHFDVAVSIWFETHEGDYHYDDYDENIVWIMAHCRGDLDKNLDDFEILHVSKYNGKSRVKDPMDDSLVPVMNKNQLDGIAEQFLRDHYKKALLEPMWIDPTELAESMGLAIRYENITKDGFIFGRSFYYDCETELYDEDADAMYKVTIPAANAVLNFDSTMASLAEMENVRLGARNPYNADLLAIARKLPMNFSGALDALIGWSEMTEEELAETADMSEKTIQRLRNSEPDNVSIETVVQLCIGMKLLPVLSGCLLRVSGKNFMMTEQHIMYQFLLNSCYYMSINECDDMLLGQNLKPLGKLNRVS